MRDAQRSKTPSVKEEKKKGVQSKVKPYIAGGKHSLKTHNSKSSIGSMRPSKANIQNKRESTHSNLNTIKKGALKRDIE